MNRPAERGSALVYTLLALLVLSMFLSIVYERVVGLMRVSREWMWAEKALVAAESGTASAEALLLENPAWIAGEGVEAGMKFVLDESEILVRTERFRAPDIIWIFSTGTHRRQKKEIVRPVMISDPTVFAVMARQGARLGLGTIVTGSVTGSSIRLEEGSEVVGSLIARGALTVATEQAEAVFFDSAMAPPAVPTLDLKSYAKTWTRPIVSEVLPDSPLGPGYYLRKGDLTIRDVTETGVSIRVAGDLKLEGRVIMRLNATADTPMLVVEKNLTGTLSGAKLRGVIYVGGKVTLKGEGLITGTLIADDIDLSGGVVVQTFDAVANEKRPAASFWKRRLRRIRN